MSSAFMCATGPWSCMLFIHAQTLGSVGRGEEEQFTHENILDYMKKVTTVDLKQNVQVDKDRQIRAYYAGHVLGAAMFYACVEDSGMVYTRDYNMTPDRRLGAAQIERLQLDLLITESTYATTIRDSKYAREREFLKAVCMLHYN